MNPFPKIKTENKSNRSEKWSKLWDIWLININFTFAGILLAFCEANNKIGNFLGFQKLNLYFPNNFLTLNA